MSQSFIPRFLHLDLRIQVMTLQALQQMASDISGLGYNGLVLEWEAGFPFRSHPIIPNRYAYTPAEMRTFLRHCKVLGLMTVPVQQCFGHIEYILQHDRYAHLRENDKDICQLCPCKVAAARPLFRDLFAELAAVHNSDYLFIGCDETYLLGHCPECRKKAETKGKSKLFVDYVNEMCALVTALGKRPVLWADMLLRHPEAANGLPRNVILVDWNYGWPADRFGDPSPLLATGLEFWGAPSLRSHPDTFYLTDWKKHLENFRDFLPYGREKGYTGSVLTSWSTSGIYGFEWEALYEPVAMFPIRRVYPLKGFRLALAAFARAARNTERFDPQNFVLEYAMERFGFSDRDALYFREALFADPSTVYLPMGPSVKSATEVLRSIRAAQTTLNRLHPRKNSGEFAHYRLMADIRAQYLEFKSIEARVQSASFTNAGVNKACVELKKLLKKAGSLDKRFANLMKGYLHPSEIAEENRVRREKLVRLSDRLSRNR